MTPTTERTARVRIRADRTITIPADFFGDFARSSEAEISLSDAGLVIRPIEEESIVEILRKRQAEFSDLEDNSGMDEELKIIRESEMNVVRNPFEEE